jgi:hypothetical protein
VSRVQGPKLTIKKAWFYVRNLFETLFYFISILKSLQYCTVHVKHLNNNIVRNCQSLFSEKIAKNDLTRIKKVCFVM